MLEIRLIAIISVTVLRTKSFYAKSNKRFIGFVVFDFALILIECELFLVCNAMIFRKLQSKETIL